jgi:hypothetical protein
LSYYLNKAGEKDKKAVFGDRDSDESIRPAFSDIYINGNGDNVSSDGGGGGGGGGISAE